MGQYPAAPSSPAPLFYCYKTRSLKMGAPAYSFEFVCLQFCFGAFLLTELELLYLHNSSSFARSWIFFAHNGSVCVCVCAGVCVCVCLSTLKDCKQRSSTASKRSSNCKQISFHPSIFWCRWFYLTVQKLDVQQKRGCL